MSWKVEHGRPTIHLLFTYKWRSRQLKLWAFWSIFPENSIQHPLSLLFVLGGSILLPLQCLLPSSRWVAVGDSLFEAVAAINDGWRGFMALAGGLQCAKAFHGFVSSCEEDQFVDLGICWQSRPIEDSFNPFQWFTPNVMLHTCLVFLVLPPTLSPFLYLVSQLAWNAVSALLGSSLFCFPPCLPSCFAAGLVFQLVFPLFSQLGLGCCGRFLGLLLSFVSSYQESPLTRCRIPECPSIGSQWENDDRLFEFLYPLQIWYPWPTDLSGESPTSRQDAFKSCFLSCFVPGSHTSDVLQGATIWGKKHLVYDREFAWVRVGDCSRDPKVFTGFHYFVHCGAVRRTEWYEGCRWWVFHLVTSFPALHSFRGQPSTSLLIPIDPLTLRKKGQSWWRALCTDEVADAVRREPDADLRETRVPKMQGGSDVMMSSWCWAVCHSHNHGGSFDKQSYDYIVWYHFRFCLSGYFWWNIIYGCWKRQGSHGCYI